MSNANDNWFYNWFDKALLELDRQWDEGIITAAQYRTFRNDLDDDFVMCIAIERTKGYDLLNY